jgi:hypothetical protein
MNQDALKRFPNQLTEMRHDECVGECIADIVGNIFNQPMDAGYSYATALRVSNTEPNTNGSDPYSGMIGATIYGVLPTEDVAFDATTTSELYEANYKNYIEYKLASYFLSNAVRPLYSYEAISQYLLQYRMGVQLGIRWYESFNIPNQDGSLPAPTGAYTEHCIAVYEDTLLGLRVKPWLGPNYGQGGYSFMSKTTFDLVFENASCFDPYASRWMWLAKTAVTHLNLIPDILPLLKS